MRHSRTLLVLALAAVAFACTTPIEPADLAGTYVLARANGDEMPGQTEAQPTGMITVTFDTLVLRVDGSAYDARSVTGPSQPWDRVYAVDRDYRIDGREVILGPYACSNLVCPDMERRFRILGSALVESRDVYGVFLYERVGPPVP